MEIVGFLARWVTFAAILVVVGSLIFRTLVLRRAAISDATRGAVGARARRIAAWACAAVLPAALARLAVQTAEMRFPGDPWMSIGLRMVQHTAWGSTWMVQVATAVVLLSTLVVVRRSVFGAALVGALTMVLAFTPTMSSHAQSTHVLRGIAPVSDAVHVIAAGAWLGTLAVMFLTLADADHFAEDAVTYLMALLRVFSPIALASAAIVVASGTLSSYVHLMSVSELFTSRYGRALLLKLAGVLIVLFLGWRNWKRMTPGIASRGMQPIRWGMIAELGGAVLVLALTSALVVTPPPMEGMIMP